MVFRFRPCAGDTRTMIEPKERNGNRVHGIDVVIRAHPIARKLELERSLFSLLYQTFRPVHPVIVTQGFDAKSTETVMTLVQKFDWASEGHLVPQVINVPNPLGNDLRSTLLNIAISQTRMRYMAVLDCDDYLYSHAYEYLIHELASTGATISFGGINRRDVTIFERFVYSLRTKYDQFSGDCFEELMVGNFCPIHSFVVDRDKVAETDLRLDSDLQRLEDYEFILRICSKYEASFQSRAKATGVYNWHLSGAASIDFQQDTRDPLHRENRKLWNEARRRIWRRKCKIRDQAQSTDPDV
jgi:hypothetical protein